MAHIPSKQTEEIDVLPFAQALSLYDKPHARTYNEKNWLYIPDFYTEYRYILGTKGKRPLITIGINPSTAAPDALDNTLKSVESHAKSNGYDSFIMFNVYAQRATNPSDMEFGFNAKLHHENMRAFEYVLSLSEKPSIWAAWGTNVRKRPFLKTCMVDMINLGKKYSGQWFSCGKCSKTGNHPHHPLYLRKDAMLELFDIDEYIKAEW